MRSDIIRKRKIRYLEAELFDYRDSLEHIKNIREEIMHPWQLTDENIGGGKANSNTSVTENTATMILSDKRIARLERMNKIITKVYEESDEIQQGILNLYYFDKKVKRKWDVVALELNVSTATVYNARRKLLKRLADELGIVI